MGRGAAGKILDEQQHGLRLLAPWRAAFMAGLQLPSFEGAINALQKIRQYRPVRLRTLPRHDDLRRRSGGIWDNIGTLQQADADRLVGQALDAGINFIDTADVYAGGQSEQHHRPGAEEPEGAARERGRRDEGLRRNRQRARTRAARSRCHIIDGVKASLKRLQLDHVDLYQIHGFDPATPIEETLRALDNLVRHGHVRYIGVSNWAAWQIAKALGISERLGLARFESLQAYYTIAGRDLERELVPMLQSEGLGLMVWSPLAGGLLSGKYDARAARRRGQPPHDVRFPAGRQASARTTVIDAMRRIAEAHGVSVAQIALAWLLHQPAVTSVIVGAKRVEQLDDNIAATNVQLERGRACERSMKSSQLPAEYPGWMLERQGEYRRKQLKEAVDY